MTSYRNGEISHWMADTGHDAFGPAALDETYDLAVVGGGLTGLWTAYYAHQQDPDARIVVLESARIGYGGSGRNGGWVSTLLPGNRAVYARSAAGGADAVRDFQRAMIETIDEIADVVDAESIDAGLHRGGNLQVAPTPAAMERLRRAREGHLSFGYRPDEVRLLDAAATSERIAVHGAQGALYFPSTARVEPGRLTRGLADVVAKAGVTISERTRVTAVAPGLVTTERGPVRARRVAVCLEAYSASLLGGRQVIPVNSSMIVTEPLDDRAWERIGWTGRECLNDAAHTFIYAQRTDDGRIAIGGRGTPYEYGSGLPGDGQVDGRTVQHLLDRLRTMFPDEDLEVAHAWRGSIGVTRDWCASVRYDGDSGVGTVFGFAGHGVSATNLAARTLVDRMAARDTRLTALPWNEHRARAWEPEPFRWIGVRSMYRLFGLADKWEERRQATETSLIARFGSRLAGLHE